MDHFKEFEDFAALTEEQKAAVREEILTRPAATFEPLYTPG